MTELEYKGYLGTAELSVEDSVFHGKLAHLRDLVTYESATANGLVKAFQEAIDDYLANEVVTDALEAALPKMKRST